jgi:NAD(P)-dependent dehydrogenase (short-subunit alcohol dehydrogenase family)
MDYGIDERVALVSGGSRGIGYAIATALLGEGAHVAIASRTQSDLGAAAERLNAVAPGRVHAISADMTDPASVQNAVSEARERFGPISIAVSNVIGHVIDAQKEGTGPGAGTFATIPPDDYRAEFKQLFVSAWALAAACLPDMRAQRWGRICNIGSMVAREPATHLPHVLPNVVRPAVAGFHRMMADREAEHGITVNNILTGAILTERNRSYWRWLAAERGQTVGDVTSAVDRAIPAGRQGEPVEMAALVSFLCSERARFITGQSIPVNGGDSRHI